jgi:hypothetical protein
MTSAVAAAHLCIGVSSMRRLFAPSQFLSIVALEANRPQNVLLNENREGSIDVTTLVIERVRVPGSRIVTGSALHLHRVSASEARFCRVVDAGVGTEHVSSATAGANMKSAPLAAATKKYSFRIKNAPLKLGSGMDDNRAGAA